VVPVNSDTRARILDAALDCFLELGYERTTVALIRQRSGVSNGSLFHHFQTKEAIADALYVRGMAEFQHGVWEILHRRPRTLHGAVRAIIAHQLRWVEEHPETARFIYERDQLTPGSSAAAELGALNGELIDELRGWLAPFAQRGEVLTDSVLVISAFVTGPGHVLARRWLAGGLQRPLTSYVDDLADGAAAALGAASATRKTKEVSR
jgi:AcrR family transcriptional regulator